MRPLGAYTGTTERQLHIPNQPRQYGSLQDNRNLMKSLNEILLVAFDVRHLYRVTPEQSPNLELTAWTLKLWSLEATVYRLRRVVKQYTNDSLACSPVAPGAREHHCNNA